MEDLDGNLERILRAQSRLRPFVAEDDRVLLHCLLKGSDVIAQPRCPLELKAWLA